MRPHRPMSVAGISTPRPAHGDKWEDAPGSITPLRSLHFPLPLCDRNYVPLTGIRKRAGNHEDTETRRSTKKRKKPCFIIPPGETLAETNYRVYTVVYLE